MLTNTLSIVVGEELFQIPSHGDYIVNAEKRFRHAGKRPESCLCVDAHGRICVNGREFTRARDESTFPVRVFAKVV